jgi:hypothetical protein
MNEWGACAHENYSRSDRAKPDHDIGLGYGAAAGAQI